MMITAANTPYLAPQRSSIVSTRKETHDTVTLVMTLPEGYPPWKPGQFNMLYLFGHGEVPISISGELPGSPFVSHTIKAVGGVSNALTQLRPGDEIWLRGPFGMPWPDIDNGDGERDLIIVGGGIGLAPLRPVILAALQKQRKARTTIIFGARTPADILFAEDLKAWGQIPGVTVMVTVDRIDPSAPPWTGEVGLVTNLLAYARIDPQNPEKTLAMTCGPDVMMRHAAAALMEYGVSSHSIYVSAERNMKCAVGMCGRCQWGPHFVCRDGPVYRWHDVKSLWTVKEF